MPSAFTLTGLQPSMLEPVNSFAFWEKLGITFKKTALGKGGF
ncbi:hypothetical protein [Bartonella apis]|uniref:Uncharacterized protein n=1 Tax=Bartonella apis TaxID=1686310 RepID=A0A1R0F9T7_9HYPH|nr:hypothetical protein [Bartonella apis]OLY43720.1 hypothetical protein PEB0149_011540 [Bartonella apis]